MFFFLGDVFICFCLVFFGCFLFLWGYLVGVLIGVSLGACFGGWVFFGSVWWVFVRVCYSCCLFAVCWKFLSDRGLAHCAPRIPRLGRSTGPCIHPTTTGSAASRSVRSMGSSTAARGIGAHASSGVLQKGGVVGLFGDGRVGASKQVHKTGVGIGMGLFCKILMIYVILDDDTTSMDLVLRCFC